MDKPIPEAVRDQAAAWFAEYDKHNHFPAMLAEDAYAAGYAAAQQQGQAVAWCALTPSGKIAYFDGKPMVMVGPVGNEHHTTPLYTAPPSAPVGVEGVSALPGEQVTMTWAQYAELRALAQQPAAEYEVKFATSARLEKPATTEKCDFCGANPGELHAYDCTALDAQQPAAVDEGMAERFCRRWYEITGRSLERAHVLASLDAALTQHQEPTT